MSDPFCDRERALRPATDPASDRFKLELLVERYGAWVGGARLSVPERTLDAAPR
jgi:hypothetical protein